MNELQKQLLEDWFGLSEEELFEIIMLEDSSEEQMENAIIVLEEKFGYSHEEILEMAPIIAGAGRAVLGAGSAIKKGYGAAKKGIGSIKDKAKTAGNFARGIPVLGSVAGAGIDALGKAADIIGNNINPLKRDYVVRSLDDFLPGYGDSDRDRENAARKAADDEKEKKANQPLKFINKKQNESFNILSDYSLLAILENETETYNNRLASLMALEKRGIDLNEYSMSQFKSDASDTARGIAKGITFGASDNIEAGAKSLLKGTSYKNELNKARSANVAAEKRSPKLFGAGEIAGSIAVPIPGAAAVKGISAAAKLGKSGAGALNVARQYAGSSAMQSGVNKLKPYLEPKNNTPSVKNQIKKSLPTVKPIKPVSIAAKPITKKH